MFAAMMATLNVGSHAARTATKNKTILKVVSKKLKFETIYEFSRTVGAGRTLKQQTGKAGEIKETYSITFVEGKPVSKKLIASVKSPPQNEVVLMGRSGYVPSRHRFSRSATYQMVATGYDPHCQGGSGGRTASGRMASFGCVAVDPRVIPLGTELFIEGYGLAIAADTGGAIKGKKIDLCFDSRSQALAFGRKKVVVHILHGAK